MRTLREIFEDYAHYGSDVGHADKGSTHSYIEEYERLLAPYRNGCTIMEIGLAMGESVKMWNEYFSNSLIIGVDISVVFDRRELKPMNNNRIEILEFDATKYTHMIPHQHRGRVYDVIIDDASHMTQDQINTFHNFKRYMNVGGLYIMEDILALDVEREKYKSLHPNWEIIDLREKKGRFDDVLIVYKF